MKYPPAVCPFLCLFVFPEFFGGTDCRNFLNVCMKLECHIVTKPGSLKKILFWGIWAKRAQNGVF